MSKNLGNAWNQRVEMGSGAANMQSQKDRLMKMMKTGSNLRKVIVKVNKKWRIN